MKTLLISANSRKENSVRELPLITPPLNLMYIAQSLNNSGHYARILDAYCLDLNDDHIIRYVKKYNPEIIGIPLHSTDLPIVYRLTKKIKDIFPHIRFFFGGPHASAMPTEALNEFNNIDYIIRGEGDYVAPKLLDALKKNKPLKNINSISFRHKSKIVHNKQLPTVKNLDKIPIPSRDLIKQKNYYSKMSKRNPLGVIVTGKGCPNRCTFCYKLNKEYNQYRPRSPENVLDEIIEILNHGARSIEFYDELFTIDQKRCLKILELAKKEKLDFEFRIRTRVNYVNKEFLLKLKKAGCTTTSYGVESGNQHILNSIRKGTNIRMIEKVFKITHEVGINILGFFLIGLPGDTPATIRQTINFAKKLNPLYAVFANLVPFPGTYIYNKSKADGTLVGDYSINKPIPWVRLPWTKTKADLVKYSNIAYNDFYHRPRFVSSFLSQVIRQKNWNLLTYTLQNFYKNLSRIDPL